MALPRLLAALLMLTAAACSESEPESPPQTKRPDAAPPVIQVDAATVGVELPTLMTCEGGTASAAEPLIDDLSDGDAFLLRADGRNGRWLTSNDGSGNQSPRAGSALLPEPVQVEGGEDYAIHTSGRGFSGWGAAVGFALHSTAGMSCLYNASLYEGIGFEVSGQGEVRVEVTVPETLEQSLGGACTGEGCDNRHGFAIQLNPDFVRYQIGFNQLAQESGFGQAALFDSSRILGIRFRATPGQSFDLWVDDVAFFPDSRPIPDAGVDASADAAVLDGG